MGDLLRAVRFIRANASKYGVDPEKLGITGGSAGGHLSLMVATRGGPGLPAATDPVDRESSAVHAVACYYPPTDFPELVPRRRVAVGVGELSRLSAAFGPEAATPEGRARLGRAISRSPVSTRGSRRCSSSTATPAPPCRSRSERFFRRCKGGGRHG